LFIFFELNKDEQDLQDGNDLNPLRFFAIFTVKNDLQKRLDHPPLRLRALACILRLKEVRVRAMTLRRKGICDWPHGSART